MSYYMWFTILMLVSTINIADSRDGEIEREMTIKIKPGTIECFFENIKVNGKIEIEYRVINGEFGELDVDFFLYGSSGNVITADRKMADNTHRITLTETADYKFCFDNSFSRFSTKTVFFAYTITDPNAGAQNEWVGSSSWVDDGEVYDMKVEDIRDAIDRIRAYLSKARFTQDAINAHEARDRNTVENSYIRINFFSCVIVVTMLITGAVQVILVRSLFDEKSKFHGLWHKSTPRF